MNLVVFGSGSGTTLQALLQAKIVNVAAAVTDRQCRFQEIAHRASIPVIYHPFCSQHIREAHDLAIVERLKELRVPIDLILLAGYMRLVSSVLLAHYPRRVINVHPADLTKTYPDGRRRYVGANAVFEALLHGETQTRSSVIVVDEGIDTGPILVQGPWVSYTEGMPITKERALRHQEKQKALSDWPACIEAIRIFQEAPCAEFLPS